MSNFKNSTPLAPVVFEYLDVTSYLKDYYLWRKSKQEKFSYDQWSEELGFRSRSYIRMVILGKKNVSAKFMMAFSQLNFATTNEEDYFFYLCNYSQSRNHKDKKAFSNKMIEILRERDFQKKLPASSDFISTPLLPRLYTLLGFEDIQGTLKELALLMNASEETIRDSLMTLESLNLIQATSTEGKSCWKAIHETFSIPDDKGNLDLFKFHEKSLHEAIQAFHDPKHLRTYSSLILPLSPDELSDINSQINTFLADLASRYNTSQYAGRRLFQLNLNIHGVTGEQKADHIGNTNC